jgi:hypothetical protein
LLASYLESYLLILVVDIFKVLKLLGQSLSGGPILCIFRINSYISSVGSLVLDHSQLAVIILTSESIDVVLDETAEALSLVDALAQADELPHLCNCTLSFIFKWFAYFFKVFHEEFKILHMKWLNNGQLTFRRLIDVLDGASPESSTIDLKVCILRVQPGLI